MNFDRRHQIDAWLQAALDLDDEGERRRLLDRCCPQELREDVDRLLAACACPDALPPVARLRIEALYDMDQGCVEPGEEESAAGESGPRSPWSIGRAV